MNISVKKVINGNAFCLVNGVSMLLPAHKDGTVFFNGKWIETGQ